MKGTIFLLAFILFATYGTAQHTGIKFGLASTTLKGNDAADYDYRLGYTAGLLYQHHITPNIGIQTEALFTSKGAKRDFEAGGQNVEETFRLNYIDVPLMLHVSSSSFFVDAGPQVSFLARAQHIRETSGNSSSTTVKTNITDNPYAIDFGYVAGLGYRTTDGVGIELRYNGSLKNLDDEGPSVGRHRRNSVILLMLSFMLPHGSN